MRTKAFLSAGIALIALLVSLAPLAAADEDEELAASGDFFFTSVVIISEEVEEDEMTITQTFTGDITGTLTGTFAGSGTTVIELETGEFEGQAMFTFTGTVDGTLGTLAISTESEGIGDSSQGEFEIVSGTGDLANLEGEGTFEVTLGVGTYSGDLEFDEDDDEELAASGTFIAGPPIFISFEEEEDRCVIEVHFEFGMTGTLDGSGSIDITAVQEAPCAVMDVPVTFEGHGTFMGTVANVAGTFDFEIEGSLDPLGDAEAQLEIEEGTGALADLDGELTITGPTAAPNLYSGEIEFDD